MPKYTMKQIGFAIFTFVIYTMLVNWQAALMLTIGVGFHEYSHLWAAKRMGLHTKGFFLVPFMGGVALVDDKYKTYGQQAFVVLAGPVGGGLLAGATAAAYYLTGYPALAAAAAWMCFLNIFNLFPLSFMDGGQLLSTITYSINRTLGVVLYTLSTLVASVVLWHYNAVLAFLVIFLGGLGTWSEIKNWSAWRKGQTYLLSDNWLNPPKALTKGQIALTVAGWLGTIVLLGTLLYFLRSHPEASLTTIIPVKKP